MDLARFLLQHTHQTLDFICFAQNIKKRSVADPGFPIRGGGRQALSLGQKPIIWQDFCRKLRENVRPLVDPLMETVTFQLQ